MRLELVPEYRELCRKHGRQPLRLLEAAFENVHTDLRGEAIIDATPARTNEDFAVVIDLLKELLSQPWYYVHEVRPTSALVRWLRLRVRVPRCVDNQHMEQLCGLIPIAREDTLVRSPVDHRDSVLALSSYASVPGGQRRWLQLIPAVTVCAVIERIEATNCFLLSLPAGQALRSAARRNIYLKHVVISGCSVNPATIQQLHNVTASNRQHTPRDWSTEHAPASPHSKSTITSSSQHRNQIALLPPSPSASPVQCHPNRGSIVDVSVASTTTRGSYWEALVETLPSLHQDNRSSDTASSHNAKDSNGKRCGPDEKQDTHQEC